MIMILSTFSEKNLNFTKKAVNEGQEIDRIINMKKHVFEEN